MHYLESLFPEYFTKAHRLALLGAIGFSAISFFMLIRYRPSVEIRQQKTLAILVGQKEVVTRKFSDSLSFVDIPTGDSVFNGDQIFTGENSGATVVFSDSKNVINIPAKSLIKIERDKNGENIEIKNGLAEFIIQKDQVINIVKGSEVISLSSDAEIASVANVYVSGGKLIFNAKSGNIILDNKKSGKKEKITLNENIAVGDGTFTKAVGFEVRSPVFGDKIDIWSGLKVELAKSEPVDIFVSSNSDFKDVVTQTQIIKLPFRWFPQVIPGAYFIKLVSKNGFEKVFPISFYSSYDVSQFKPASHETIQIQKGDKLLLSWNGGRAKKFKVKVKDYQGKETEYITSAPELMLQNVKGSSLTWSVAPMTKEDRFLAQSKENEVLINYTGENKLISPTGKKSFKLGEAPIHFSWNARTNETYKIIIKNNRNPSNIVEKVVTNNFFDFLPVSTGQNTFTLTSIDYPNLPSLDYSFDVRSVAAVWDATSPLEYKDVDEEKKIEFGFESKMTDIKNLELKLSSSNIFDQNIRGHKILSKKIKFTMSKFGNYCFKINSIIPDSFVQDSEIKCVKFSQIPPFGSLTAPKNIVMSSKTINGVEAYLVEVPPVARATSFELQIFKDIQGSELVFTTRSASNKMTWVSSKSGIFYYHYRAIDSKNRKSDYSQMGRLIFPISPLSDWQE